ncbi:hypothetical protein, partial [Pseudomonas pergaminensis]
VVSPLNNVQRDIRQYNSRTASHINPQMNKSLQLSRPSPGQHNRIITKNKSYFKRAILLNSKKRKTVV